MGSSMKMRRSAALSAVILKRGHTRRLTQALCICALPVLAGPYLDAAMANDVSATVPHARPGHLAELEELEAARRAGTRAAYDLFLARHPGSRYAPQARRERAKLTQ
jgi:hypothetical protein